MDETWKSDEGGKRRRQKSGTQTSVTMETIGSRNGEFRVCHTKATHAITDREIHR